MSCNSIFHFNIVPKPAAQIKLLKKLTIIYSDIHENRHHQDQGIGWRLTSDINLLILIKLRKTGQAMH